MTNDDGHLFGLVGAEVLYDDPATVWEAEIQPSLCDDGAGDGWVIEEWTSVPPIEHLPSLEALTDYLAEHGADDQGLDSSAVAFDQAAKSPPFLKALAMARRLLADGIHTRAADKLVATHTLTVSAADGLVLYDGAPLYKEAPARSYRIALRPDKDGEEVVEATTALDDIVVKDVSMFRAEDMGRSWWFCCYLDDEQATRISFSLDKKTGVLVVTEMPDGVEYE